MFLVGLPGDFGRLSWNVVGVVMNLPNGGRSARAPDDVQMQRVDEKVILTLLPTNHRSQIT